MRELSDEQIEAMTPAEKAEYARRRAASKYHQPHLDREGDGGSRRILFQGLAIAGAVVVAAGFVWAYQTPPAAEELDKWRTKVEPPNQFQNIHEAHKGAKR